MREETQEQTDHTLESFYLSGRRSSVFNSPTTTPTTPAEATTPATQAQLRGLENDKMEWIYLQEPV